MTQSSDKQEIISLITGFIVRISIPVKKGKVQESSFLPGIEIENGDLVYDPEGLLYPGDLLHEAGHIALLPAEHRNKVSGNMADQKYTDGGEEVGVLLWSYAAALAICLPPEVVFHPQGYKGQSQWLLEQFTSGTYIGLPLLQWMKLCKPDGEETGFPVMQKWLRD